MANYGPAYGSLANNLVKIAAKRDPELENEIQTWIESVIGERFPDCSYEDALKDGIILCKLMNRLEPNAIDNFTITDGGFRSRENILLFQNAARAYGLADLELFQTIDLYEKRNIPQVTHCLLTLGRLAQKKNFNGPLLRHNAPEFRPCKVPEDKLFPRRSLAGLRHSGLKKSTHFFT